jgi:hypothetical protein
VRVRNFELSERDSNSEKVISNWRDLRVFDIDVDFL